MRHPQKKYKVRYITRTQKNPSVKPLVFGIFLILLITLVFLSKKTKEENQIELKMQQIEKERSEMENVEVDLATSKEVFNSINNENIQLIDIRNREEFDFKHIEASTNIPLSSIEENIGLIKKGLKTIIIDRDDSPQGRIFTDHLKKQGIEAKYLNGGITKFANDGYPLITIGNPLDTGDLLKVSSVNSEQILEMIFEGKRLALVDLRTKQKFQESNIPGSINIPLEELEKRKYELPSKFLVLYDSEPLRSFRAAVRLHDMGVYQSYNCIDEYEVLHKRLQEELDRAKNVEAADQ